MNTIAPILALIIDSWSAFMWRNFGQPDVSQQVGQGRPRRHGITQAEFWCVYLFVVLPLLVVAAVAAWRAWA
ncbi:MAG TPA: hypothetical protein VN201_13400 [Roseateles sp.]|nr:hypothetical protein [Roseateles sp.]